jgi:hypothetical protein
MAEATGRQVACAHPEDQPGDGRISGMQLTRQQLSDAVEGHGWCLIPGTLQAHVPAGSLAAAAGFAAQIAALDQAPGHVLTEARDDQVMVTVRTGGDDGVLAGLVRYTG